MRLTTSVSIEAAADRAWSVLIDVDRWPEWTASVTRVARLDDAPLHLGSRVRIEQPRLPGMTWSVTEFVEGKRFAWEASSRGVHTVASHVVESTDGGCRVTLSLEQSGWPLILLGWWMKRIGERYMGMEAQGLRQRCEAA